MKGISLEIKQMELRRQEKEIGMPNSLNYNSAQHNQESSSKLSPASVIPNVADGRRNEAGQQSTIINTSQTLDHSHLYHYRHLNQQQQQTQRLERLPNPDPVLAAAATIGTASNSNSKPLPLPLPLPPPLPPPPQLQPTNSAAPIQYRECQKNHAASMGGHVVDGCREFMPSGEEGTQEGLKCAACDCHRNFHRKEVEGEPQSGVNSFCTYNHSKNNSRRAVIHPTQAPPPSLHHPPPQLQHHKFPHGGYSHGLSTSPPAGPVPQVMVAFGGGSGAPAESSSEDLNMFQSNAGAQPGGPPSFSSSKKRFRTKFTQQQKDRMQEFAEKLGWKIQKQDEQEVQQFCAEMGVKRQVFKVWMHNNKQAMKKKQL